MARNPKWRDYQSLNRDDLIRRLRHAENVCIYLGWTAIDDGSPRAEALSELWQRWARQPDVSSVVEDNAELAGSEAALAAARRATRDSMLRKLMGD